MTSLLGTRLGTSSAGAHPFVASASAATGPYSPIFQPPLPPPRGDAPAATTTIAAASTAAFSLLRLSFRVRSGRFSVVQHSTHLIEKTHYAAKVVDNNSLADEENLEALETEVRAMGHTCFSPRLRLPPRAPSLLTLLLRHGGMCVCLCAD